MNPQAYFALAVSLFVVWAFLFFFSSSTRKEQMFVSLIGVLLAPGVLYVALVDYRRTLPVSGGPITVEDFLFAFSLCGIAAVLYQALLGKHVKRLRGERVILHPRHMHWLSQIIIIFAVWASVSMTLTALFPIASVYAFAVGGLLIATYIIADRHDLLLNALVSGLFLSFLVFVLEQIFFTRLFPVDAGSAWQIENLSGILLGSVPIEELLWIGTVGFALGPLYEYVRRYQLK